MLLFLIGSTDNAASESSLLNGTAKGNDAANSGNQKVCLVLYLTSGIHVMTGNLISPK